MRISVTVTPNAREEKVTPRSPTDFLVSVTAPARDGRANAALVKALAAYFGFPPSTVVLKRGFTSRRKIIELPDR